MPGLVAVHAHLYHVARPNLCAEGTSGPLILVRQMTFPAPRLCLVAGVTTTRTAGSGEPYADLNVRKAIDEGRMAGPRVEVTGHLCSVTDTEAADLGVDNLEHGFFVNTQLDPDKKPDACSKEQGGPTLKAMDPESEAARQLIAKLVARHVAITSTLPVFEHRVPNRPPLRTEVLDALSPQAREAFLLARTRRAAASPEVPLADFKRAMALERAFAAAGGLLVAGCDPTGNGGTLPGFGDQREVELLVEAGFSPVDAIRIATYNGAVLLGKADRIGSIAPGLAADLLVVKGDPSTRIEEIEKPVLVFKDGVGYDPGGLLGSVRGRYGLY